jgi:predicted nucleotidyltransferase
MVRQSAPETVRPVFEAAREVQEFLRSAGHEFCIIGGVALQRWGQPRLTLDVDLTMLVPLGSEAEAVDEVLAAFAGRLPDARAFALKNRVILAKTAKGVAIDVSLGALDYERRCVERASDFDFGGGVRLRTCSAEDLVVLKAFAGRGQDWVDLEHVIVRQRASLDWRLIESELAPLLELSGAPETGIALKALRDRIEKSAS